MSAPNPFKPAVREEINLRLLLLGLSGQGKTFTALAIACHLAQLTGRRVAFIDTEDGAARKYAGELCQCHACRGHGIRFEFDVVELARHHPQEWLAMMQAATAGGYGILVLDSISHEWQACLEDVDQRQRQVKNKHSAWGPTTEAHNAFLAGIRSWPGHLIACCRAKEKHSSEGGKVTSLGVLPVQRDGIEYELDVALFMSGATGRVVKTRAAALQERIEQRPGLALAQDLLAWTGSPAAAQEQATPAAGAPQQQPDEAPQQADEQPREPQRQAQPKEMPQQAQASGPETEDERQHRVFVERRNRRRAQWEAWIRSEAEEAGEQITKGDVRLSLLLTLAADRQKLLAELTYEQLWGGKPPEEALSHEDLTAIKAWLEGQGVDVDQLLKGGAR